MKESIDSIPSPLITNNIGLVNLELNDTAVAREYFNRGLKIAQKFYIQYLKMEISAFAEEAELCAKHNLPIVCRIKDENLELCKLCA